MTARLARNLIRDLGAWVPPAGVTHAIGWQPSTGQVFITLTSGERYRTFEISQTDYRTVQRHLWSVAATFVRDGAAPRPRAIDCTDEAPEPLLPWLANSLEAMHWILKHDAIAFAWDLIPYAMGLLRSIEADDFQEPTVSATPDAGIELRWLMPSERGLIVQVLKKDRLWIQFSGPKIQTHDYPVCGTACQAEFCGAIEWLCPGHVGGLDAELIRRIEG